MNSSIENQRERSFSPQRSSQQSPVKPQISSTKQSNFNYEEEDQSNIQTLRKVQKQKENQKQVKKQVQNDLQLDNLNESSDGDDHKEINHKSEAQQNQVVNVLDMMQPSPAIQIKNIKADSLQHDIKLGWIPKTQITGPIPLSFGHAFLDAIIQEKIWEKKLVYLGYRPTNTFEAHQKYYQEGKKYPFYQFHLCKSQFLERFFKKYYSGYEFTSSRQVGMIEIEKSEKMKEMKKDDQIEAQLSENPNKNADKDNVSQALIFDSVYEGGNLDAVYYEDNQYRLVIRVDSNTKGHCNYFNFKYFFIKRRIKCLKPGKYRFRIMNMSKKKSLYERGMKPYIKITNLRTKADEEWRQAENECENVKFGLSPLNEYLQDVGKFYSLKFQLQLKNQFQYHVAYSIPFVYSDLIQSIAKIRQNKNLHVGKLCFSLSGVQVPLLTISQNQQKEADQSEITQKQDSKNYYIVITGRIHPAETNGSHIVNGLIKFLLKDHPLVKQIRKKIVFKIVPMMNPDGVILGNTRTSVAGKDLNRKFSSKTEFIFPQVNNLRDYVLKLKEKHGKKLLFVIDIHGHSTRKGSFFFGPEFPVLDEEYSKCRLLPRFYANRSQAFRYYSCKFKIAEYKEATSRGFFNANGIRTYTHQTSVHSYYDFKSRKDLAFTKKTLQKLGEDLVLAISDYVERLKFFTTVVNKKNPLKTTQSKKQIQKTKQIINDIPILNDEQERQSDKMPSDKADSESDGDDIDDKELNVFYQRINQNREYFYEEILKNLKNKQDELPTLGPKKEKNFKSIESEKDRKQKEKQREREEKLKKQEEKKKLKINWANKITYTPKKTLFEQYSKLSSVVMGKNSSYKATNSLIPKLKSAQASQQISPKRNLSDKNQSALLSFEKMKLEGHSNRIIYSVPHIKWDFSSQVSIKKRQNSQLYRYDFNQYSETEPEEKKSKQKLYHKKQGVLNSEIAEKDGHNLKLNKQTLKKLLEPSSVSLILNKPKNQQKTNLIRDPKVKYKSIINERMIAINDYRRNLSTFSQMKNRVQPQFLNQKKDNASPLQGPQVQSKKEEYLCKKWEKEIVQKTKKNYSMSSKVIYSDSKLMGTERTSFNAIFNNSNKTLRQEELYLKKDHQNDQSKGTLPKIYLNKKEVTSLHRTIQNN